MRMWTSSGHGLRSRTSVYITALVTVTAFVWISPVSAQLVSGSVATCDNEGEIVHVPLVSDDPCITCICQNGKVECSQEKCLNLEGCYMIPFDNSNQPKKRCCDVCKGCTYNGTSYKSDSSWVDKKDPCVTFSCRAAVVTRSVTQCHVPCANPVIKRRQCCPSCKDGCRFEGKVYKDGDKFSMSDDPCVQCKCKRGSITCTKKSCPVLNCPPRTIYQPKDSCCPACTGKRKIFNIPDGKWCFFRNRIYKSGQKLSPENCTHCVCQDGSMMCNRENCPVTDCPGETLVETEGSCCRTCPVKRQCSYEGVSYKHRQTWKPNVCTKCECTDGTTHCQVQHCSNALWCPDGYRLQFTEGECCPRCVESTAVCTVFGDPHYRTYDGRMYNFQGTCKYLLTEDCDDKTFSIRVRNDARMSSRFAWTRMLVITLGNTRISLHRKMNVKVDRVKVRLPYTNHAEFSVVRKGRSVVFQATQGLKVVWDGDSFVEVSVATVYKNKLCGLCGNYNGLGADDMRGKDGKLYYDGEQFGHSWRVGSKRACAIRPEVLTAESRCTKDPAVMLKARHDCSLLLSTVFSRCRRKIDVRSYYSSCVADMCDCPEDKNCACESFKAYAHACSQKGIDTKWEQYSECSGKHKCPRGAKFDRCGPACPETCDTLNNVQPCLKPCVAGCHCPAGRVLHYNACIRSSDCPVR